MTVREPTHEALTQEARDLFLSGVSASDVQSALVARGASPEAAGEIVRQVHAEWTGAPAGPQAPDTEPDPPDRGIPWLVPVVGALLGAAAGAVAAVPYTAVAAFCVVAYRVRVRRQLTLPGRIDQWEFWLLALVVAGFWTVPFGVLRGVRWADEEDTVVGAFLGSLGDVFLGGGWVLGRGRMLLPGRVPPGGFALDGVLAILALIGLAAWFRSSLAPLFD